MLFLLPFYLRFLLPPFSPLRHAAFLSFDADAALADYHAPPAD